LGQVLDITIYCICEEAQRCSAVGRVASSPFFLCTLGKINGLICFFNTEVFNSFACFFGRRVDDGVTHDELLVLRGWAWA
jgi:hypothetical protein